MTVMRHHHHRSRRGRAYRTVLGAAGILLFLFLPHAPVSPAADAGAAVPDVFNPGAARHPRAGEWLEYRVAYPADPLENSLDPNPAVPPSATASGQEGSDTEVAGIHPMSAPPAAWRVLPLRLEILAVEEGGCRVATTFAGVTREVFMPLTVTGDGAEFHYNAPQPQDGTGTHRVSGTDYPVAVTRRHGDGYGFVRLSNPDLPFGIARFATADVDLILIGAGEGHPPAFPLPDDDAANPPPGMLYHDPAD